MKMLAGGCRVFSPEDGQISTLGNWTARSVISRAQRARTGSPRLFTTTRRALRPPWSIRSPKRSLYVVSGEGACRDRRICAIRSAPVAPMFVPAGGGCSIENPGPGVIRIVSACCPEDPERHIAAAPASHVIGELRRSGGPRRRSRPDPRRRGSHLPLSGLHRSRLPSRSPSSSDGFPRAKRRFITTPTKKASSFWKAAASCTSTTESCEFGPGCSIYFPVGVRHCVENPGDATIKLLGSFYPSGSPGAAYEDDRR